MPPKTAVVLLITMAALAALPHLVGCAGTGPVQTQPLQARALDIDLVDAAMFGMHNVPAKDGGLSGMAARAPLSPPMQILVWTPIGRPLDEESVRAAMASAGLELGPIVHSFPDSPQVDGATSLSWSIGQASVATSWECESSDVSATLFTIARQNNALDEVHLRSLSTAKCAPAPPPVPVADETAFAFSMPDFERSGDTAHAIRFVRDSDQTIVQVGATLVDSRLIERPATCAGALSHVPSRVKAAAGIAHGKEEALPVANGCASQTAEPDDPIHGTFAFTRCADERVLHIEIVTKDRAVDRNKILAAVKCTSA
jgi:hypothetical protein